ncbi:hypothetical protein QL285_053158 [Trifolium repens]|nr:hypothetical protein QL285_053158 [Trifolium repens]
MLKNLLSFSLSRGFICGEIICFWMGKLSSPKGMSVIREVVDGQIILPERYKDVKTADLAGEDGMDVEEGDDEEDDGTSKKTITPEDDD